MTTLLKAAVLAAVVAVHGVAFAASINCAIDNRSMHFTGNVRTEMGKLLREYECPNGHITWVVRN